MVAPAAISRRECRHSVFKSPKFYKKQKVFETQIQTVDWQFVNSDLTEVHSHSFLDTKVNPDLLRFRNVWAPGGDGATERHEIEAVFVIYDKSQVGKGTDIDMKENKKVINMIWSLKKEQEYIKLSTMWGGRSCDFQVVCLYNTLLTLIKPHKPCEIGNYYN